MVVERGKTECLGGLQVDDQVELCWKLYRKLARLLALKNPVNECRRPSIIVSNIVAVGQEATSGRKGANDVQSREILTCHDRGYLAGFWSLRLRKPSSCPGRRPV